MRVRLLAFSFVCLIACGDDPVVPPASPNETGGGAGAAGDGTSGGASGDGGAAAGQSGAPSGGTAGGGAAGTSGGGAAGASTGGSSAGGAPAASGAVHGSLRDLGSGKMGLRLGDFPFACAEYPTEAACGAANRALVVAELPANAIVVGAAALAVSGQIVTTTASPACGKSSAPFTGSLTITAVDANGVKVQLAGASGPGFDGEHTLGRCTAAVAPGNAIAFRTAAGVRIEAADYALTCATAPNAAPCGDRYRLDFTLPTGPAKGTQIGLATTNNPMFVSTSAEATGCKTDQGALTGQIEIVDVLGDRLRLRALGTNVAEANKTVYDALFCD